MAGEVASERLDEALVRLRDSVPPSDDPTPSDGGKDREHGGGDDAGGGEHGGGDDAGAGEHGEGEGGGEASR